MGLHGLLPVYYMLMEDLRTPTEFPALLVVLTVDAIFHGLTVG